DSRPPNAAHPPAQSAISAARDNTQDLFMCDIRAEERGGRIYRGNGSACQFRSVQRRATDETRIRVVIHRFPRFLGGSHVAFPSRVNLENLWIRYVVVPAGCRVLFHRWLVESPSQDTGCQRRSPADFGEFSRVDAGTPASADSNESRVERSTLQRCRL